MVVIMAVTSIFKKAIKKEKTKNMTPLTPLLWSYRTNHLAPVQSVQYTI